MPLMLLALDNTLLDREAAFRAWGAKFLAEIGAPPEDLEWLVSIDADGLTSRWDLADSIQARYRLRASAVDLVDELDLGLVEHTRLDPLVACALRIADDAGWMPVVVSNGPAYRQESIIRRTGLDHYVADWVISEAAGVSKPNPRIFTLAAERVRMHLRGAWIVGDSPEADIGAAAAMGLPSVWLHRGRQWMESRFEPTTSAGSLIQGLSAVLAGGRVVHP
ncbi:HAD family hydrolase [Catenuloplanes atrovinosus]|uniref:Hydrolase of the HAD superfamily n=1 Tax=Catenuloplanes atrovinosus TaxID=137266 RepID=A0AAE4CDW9_9ACTN|nr:HAD family hydrolase [Catenuloplanes atrovinosus]MDR7277965.1 putative hydrolase of the HAD superfamily [Catenuloplanes atrovinosus]